LSSLLYHYLNFSLCRISCHQLFCLLYPQHEASTLLHLLLFSCLFVYCTPYVNISSAASLAFSCLFMYISFTPNVNSNLDGCGCVWLPKLWRDTTQNSLK
jgi:hypothetical protein